MRDVVSLAVPSGLFGGWTRTSITRGIEQISGVFEFELTERWPGQGVFRPIQTGDECTTSVDGEVILTGFVDDVVPSFNAEGAQLRCVGRDATGDLVDCSARFAGGEWTGADLAQIARDLLAPFGVPLSVETDIGGPWTHKFALQTGESVFEALERAARMRGVLLCADGRGGLKLTRAGQSRIGTALVEGDNILAGEGFQSLRERFSEYEVLAQSPGSDIGFGETVSAVRALERDSGVPRYRPLILQAEDNADQASADRRARWEKNIRIGRNARATITVQGWSHAGGVWQPNELVDVDSPTLKLEGTFLVASVRFEQDPEGGTITTLGLARPSAYDVEPLAENDGEPESLF